MTSEINAQDWQQAFIATNILAIGYNAWVGYLGGERGVVICTKQQYWRQSSEFFFNSIVRELDFIC